MIAPKTTKKNTGGKLRGTRKGSVKIKEQSRKKGKKKI